MVKNLPAMQETWVWSLGQEDPLEKAMGPVFFPGEFHGQRGLTMYYSPWGPKELDVTEQLIGERNGNPLQRSCLENPRDGGAWWAAVYGVAQSRTRLKWLSSSRATNTFLKSLEFVSFSPVPQLLLHHLQTGLVSLTTALSLSSLSFIRLLAAVFAC